MHHGSDLYDMGYDCGIKGLPAIPDAYGLIVSEDVRLFLVGWVDGSQEHREQVIPALVRGLLGPQSARADEVAS